MEGVVGSEVGLMGLEGGVVCLVVEVVIVEEGVVDLAE